ncbi:MAG: type I methionyl aminopeptidase [Candidatus Shapirobacteria bacterium]
MIPIKTPVEIEIMREGGRKLAGIMGEVVKAVKPGIRLIELEKLAVGLINKSGGEAAFKKVKSYGFATCLNVNEGVVHGIPNGYQIKEKDLVSVDMGLLYRGFNTDMAVSLAFGGNYREFLTGGKKALAKAIEASRVGNRVSDLSWAIESEIKAVGYQPVRVLTGHGVGRELHEEPLIPGWIRKGKTDRSPRLAVGMTLAIEVIYGEGKGEVVLEDDGWTIASEDGKMTGLFEETIAVTEKGPLVLTLAS